ncbi:tetratricopeptide repeat protein [Silvibacterium dinghuense]|nr:tetratricopeptide repeat protein [Silvibacterium dinghuense]GGH01787.1 hypothetical protein GCM10011586_16820 [Silvibacterium dinghuense]
MIPPATRRAHSLVLVTALVLPLLFPGRLIAQLPVSLSHPVAGALPAAFDLSHVSRLAEGRSPQLEVPETSGDGFAALPPETQGDLLMVRHQYLAAIDAYRRGPHDSAVIWNKLGIAYQHMYALDFARMQYEKALSLEPNYAEALNNLGTVYYGQKSYHKAESYYRRALRSKPNTAAFYCNLGTAYFADHKYRQGLAAYQQALVLDPEIFIRESLARIAEMGTPEAEAQLNYALAKLYAQSGNFDAAMRCLRAAFSDGFDDRKHLMEDKELAGLRGTPQFHLFLTEEHWQN